MAGSVFPARGYWSESEPPPDPPTLVERLELPFDMPLDAEFAASDVLMAPHLMTTQERSITNRNHATDPLAYEVGLFPPGQVKAGVNHRATGGYWRNGPVGRDTYGSVGNGENTDAYRLLDRRWEMQQLKATGMRHMIVDILGVNALANVQRCAQAAILEDMPRAIVAMPDCSSAFVRNGAAQLATSLAAMFGGPYADGYYKHTDGRWLVMPYGPEFAVNGGTEAQVIAFWVTVMENLETLGYPSALWCMFSRSWESSADRTAPTFNNAALSDWFVGTGRWGTGIDPVTSAGTGTGEGGAEARSQSVYGVPFCYSARNEDIRVGTAASGIFWESGGWQNLMVSMNNTITNGHTAVQIPTWNDWWESSGIAPSRYHGHSVLDVFSYYVCKKRLGYAPPIIRDTLYLAHRIHQTPELGNPTFTAPALSGVSYTSRQIRTGGTAARNEVDVMGFLTAPGVVKIRVGSTTYTHNVVSVAEPFRVQAPLAAGTISCWVERGGVEVAGTRCDSPWTVNFTTQEVQDLSYRRMSSRR